MIAELQASGATSLRAIARALNDRGIPTARGSRWFRGVRARRGRQDLVRVTRPRYPPGRPLFAGRGLPPRRGPQDRSVDSLKSPPRFGRLRVCVGVCVVACLLEWLSQAFVRVLPGRALSRDDRRGTGLLPAGEPPHGAPTKAPAGRFPSPARRWKRRSSCLRRSLYRSVLTGMASSSFRSCPARSRSIPRRLPRSGCPSGR